MAEKTAKADQLRAMREAKFSKRSIAGRAPADKESEIAKAKEDIARASALADARGREREEKRLAKAEMKTKQSGDTTEMPIEGTEEDMAKKSKSKAKAGTKKAKAKPGRAIKAKVAAKSRKAKNGEAKVPRANGHGSKLDGIKELLTRPGGCTRADILALTRWPSVSVPQQAVALGLALKIDKQKGEPKRYSA